MTKEELQQRGYEAFMAREIATLQIAQAEQIINEVNTQIEKLKTEEKAETEKENHED